MVNNAQNTSTFNLKQAKTSENAYKIRSSMLRVSWNMSTLSPKLKYDPSQQETHYMVSVFLVRTSWCFKTWGLWDHHTLHWLLISLHSKERLWRAPLGQFLTAPTITLSLHQTNKYHRTKVTHSHCNMETRSHRNKLIYSHLSGHVLEPVLAQLGWLWQSLLSLHHLWHDMQIKNY